MSHPSSEVDYLIQDAEGKVLDIVRHTAIKRELSISPVDMYNQQSDSISEQQYVRLQNSYQIGQTGSTSYLKTPAHTSGSRQGTIKYEHTNMGSIKLEDKDSKMQKFVNRNSNTSQKFTPHTSTVYKVQSSISRRTRKSDKVGKGLRHFSMKVCEKVKDKGSTTYNEVADELVAEEVESCQSSETTNCDQKNIRRRVYDALNVLMAMNIISKDKKEIRWIGLPTNSVQQCNSLEKENQKRKERIERKQQELKELLLQQISLKSLVERNKKAERQGTIPTPNSSIQLPFIIVNTHKTTKINCSVSTDKSEYYFKFNDKFEIHDDVDVLKRMGLLFGLDKGECTPEDIERAKAMVPKIFEKYVESYGKGQDDVVSEEWDNMAYIDMIDSSGFSKNLDQSSENADNDEEMTDSDID